MKSKEATETPQIDKNAAFVQKSLPVARSHKVLKKEKVSEESPQTKYGRPTKKTAVLVYSCRNCHNYSKSHEFLSFVGQQLSCTGAVV